jgi:uncharacterized protein DUF1329
MEPKMCKNIISEPKISKEIKMCAKKVIIVCIITVFMAVGASNALAKVSAEEAAKLNTELTPMGAERAGNADGTIPAWTGEAITPPADYKGPGYHYPDPFASDKPLFTITAKNVDQYKDKLSPGQIALLKTYPDTFTMPVYKSRRTATYPDWYYENSIKHATTVVSVNDGNGIQTTDGGNVYRGVPFPITKDPHEMLWNHMLAYKGIWQKTNQNQMAPDAAGRYVLSEFEYSQFNPYYAPVQAGGDNPKLYMVKVTKNAPPRTAGDIYLLQDFMNMAEAPRQVWRYFAGQRRVRRAPSFSHDSPLPSSLGLMTIDEREGWRNAPNEKFSWTLKGKREMYVPYNTYKLADPKLKYKEDIIRKGHLNSELTRYELHRVWELEGTLKDGERHVYSKRVVFIDEDSWNIAVTDAFDERGEIWRVNLCHIMTLWDLPTTMQTTVVTHDMVARRYYVDPLMNELSKSYQFFTEAPESSYFSPAALRRGGVR